MACVLYWGTGTGKVGIWKWTPRASVSMPSSCLPTERCSPSSGSSCKRRRRAAAVEAKLIILGQNQLALDLSKMLDTLVDRLSSIVTRQLQVILIMTPFRLQQRAIEFRQLVIQ